MLKSSKVKETGKMSYCLPISSPGHPTSIVFTQTSSDLLGFIFCNTTSIKLKKCKLRKKECVCVCMRVCVCVCWETGWGVSQGPCSLPWSNRPITVIQERGGGGGGDVDLFSFNQKLANWNHSTGSFDVKAASTIVIITRQRTAGDA